MLIIDGFRAGPRTESQMTRPTGRCDRDLGSGLSSAGPSRGTRGVKHDAASGRRDQCHAAMQGSARISGSPSAFPTSPNEGRAARRGPTGPCSTIRVLERCARRLGAARRKSVTDAQGGLSGCPYPPLPGRTRYASCTGQRALCGCPFGLAGAKREAAIYRVYVAGDEVASVMAAPLWWSCRSRGMESPASRRCGLRRSPVRAGACAMVAVTTALPCRRRTSATAQEDP
jgi:hypothetical protein